MSKEQLQALKDLEDGEIQTIDLACGSKLTIERSEAGYPGYYITITDRALFAVGSSEKDDEDIHSEDYDIRTLKMIVLDSALPALRALLCGLSHK